MVVAVAVAGFVVEEVSVLVVRVVVMTVVGCGRKRSCRNGGGTSGKGSGREGGSVGGGRDGGSRGDGSPLNS